MRRPDSGPFASPNQDPGVTRPDGVSLWSMAVPPPRRVEAPAAFDPFPAGPLTVPPPEPTLMRQRYTDAYGRTGTRLLRHAEEGDGEARYRLAALLACDDRANESWYWLQRAAQIGHAGASALTEHPDVPHYWMGSEAAYQIGLDYEAEDLPYSAAVFFERAAHNGHPDAAYRAGLHYVQTGNPWAAFNMFSRAARNGHPHAQHEFDALYRQNDLSALAATPQPQPPPWIPISPPDGVGFA